MNIRAFSLIEVLISLFILTTALFGFLLAQSVTMRYQHEARLILEGSNLLLDLNLGQLFGGDEGDCRERSQRVLPSGHCNVIGDSSEVSWQLPGLTVQTLRIR